MCAFHFSFSTFLFLVFFFFMVSFLCVSWGSFWICSALVLSAMLLFRQSRIMLRQLISTGIALRSVRLFSCYIPPCKFFLHGWLSNNNFSQVFFFFFTYRPLTIGDLDYRYDISSFYMSIICPIIGYYKHVSHLLYVKLPCRSSVQLFLPRKNRLS